MEKLAVKLMLGACEIFALYSAERENRSFWVVLLDDRQLCYGRSMKSELDVSLSTCKFN